MSHILVIGNTTLDIVNQLDHYPAEDEEMRAIQQRITQGGNAANTATVLAQLGHHVELVTTLADDINAQHIRKILQSNNVLTQYCFEISNSKSPTSYISLNNQNGSRTIVHYRDLAELSFEQFQTIPLELPEWIHIEGRNIETLTQIMRFINQQDSKPKISLEIEKPRKNIEQLIPYADIILFSKVYAKANGFDSASHFLEHMHQQYADKILICSWGENGAAAIDNNSERMQSPSFPPEQIIDTVGAGDTFNASIIHTLLRGYTLEHSLLSACKLAGEKIAQHGFTGLTSSDYPA